MKNILENLAIDLYNAGYKVAFWSDKSYNENWRKNDMTSVVAGKIGNSNIINIEHDRVGYEMIDYIKLYIPCYKHGSGARAGSGKGTLEEFEKAILQPLDFESEIKRYKDIDDWMKRKIYDFYEFLDPKKTSR